jgi:flagellar basal body-associated protein FliL
VGVGDIAFIAGLGAMPLALAAFILGVVVTADEKRSAWLVAVIVAGVLALVGLGGMAWVLLSASSLVAFQTPLVVVPIVTALSTFWPDPQRRTASRVS